MRLIPLLLLLIAINVLHASGQSFTLSAAPDEQEYPVGSNAMFNVEVIPSGGYSATVHFSAAAPTLPSRAISISKTFLNAPYAGGFIVTIHRKNGNLPGRHPIFLEGWNGTLRTYDTVYLMIHPTRGWSFYHPGNSGLPHSEITAIEVEKNGTGWIGTKKGVARFDKNNWTVYDHEDFGGTEDFVKSIAIDSSGAIWAGLANGYIVRFKDNVWSRFYVSLPSYSGPTVTSLEVAPDGVIWCVVGNRLTRFENEQASPFDDTYATLVAIDRRGNIWSWYNQSAQVPIRRFDGTFWTVYSRNEIGGVSEQFTTFAFDAQNNFWAAHLSGVLKFDGTAWIDFDGDAGNFPGPGPWGIDFDPDGMLWISNPFHSKGIARYDGFVTTRYTTFNSGLPDDNVTHITAGPDGTIWMAIVDGLVLFNPRVAAGAPLLEEPRASIDIHPNPTAGSSMLHLQIPKGSPTRITLHDQLGREARRVFEGRLEMGEHHLPLDLDGLSSGHYLVRITSGGTTSTEPLMIVR